MLASRPPRSPWYCRLYQRFPWKPRNSAERRAFAASIFATISSAESSGGASVLEPGALESFVSPRFREIRYCEISFVVNSCAARLGFFGPWPNTSPATNAITTTVHVVAHTCPGRSRFLVRSTQKYGSRPDARNLERGKLIFSLFAWLFRILVPRKPSLQVFPGQPFPAQAEG